MKILCLGHVEPCFLTPRPRRIASSLATSDMVGGLAVQAAEQAGLVFRPRIRGLRAMIVQFEQNPAAVRINPAASICTCAGVFLTQEKGLEKSCWYTAVVKTV